MINEDIKTMEDSVCKNGITGFFLILYKNPLHFKVAISKIILNINY